MATPSLAVAAATPPADQAAHAAPLCSCCCCYFLNTNLPAFLLFVPSLVSHNKTTVGWPRSRGRLRRTSSLLGAFGQLCPFYWPISGTRAGSCAVYFRQRLISELLFL